MRYTLSQDCCQLTSVVGNIAKEIVDKDVDIHITRASFLSKEDSSKISDLCDKPHRLQMFYETD